MIDRSRQTERLHSVAIFAISAALLGWNTGLGSLYNGDEATYALFARAMRAGGDLLHMRLGGAILHQRPPLYPWLLTLSTSIFGENPFALRLPAVLLGAGSAALLYRLARDLGFGRLTAAVAGLLLPTLALEFLYARAVVSDVPLAFFILLAIRLFVAGAGGDRPRTLLAAGAALGAALMTKQIIGLVPLVAPLAFVLGRGRRGLPPARQLALAGLVTLVVAAPWHVAMLVLDGRPFIDGYLGFNVLRRALSSVLPPTTATYYLERLWDKEGAIALLVVPGLALAAWRGLRERHPGSLLLVLWLGGVLALFSAASSRVDYYLLPAYPALALLIALPLEVLGARAGLAATLGVAVLGASAALHVPQRLDDVDRSAELTRLGAVAAAASRPDDPLIVIDDLPFVPAFASRRPTILVVTRRANFDALSAIDLFRAPGNMVHVSDDDLPAWLAAHPRYLALVPIQELRHRAPPGAHIVERTPRYVLYGNLPF